MKKLIACFIAACLFAVWAGTKIPHQDQEHWKHQRHSRVAYVDVDDCIGVRAVDQQENPEIEPEMESEDYDLFRFLLYGSGYGW